VLAPAPYTVLPVVADPHLRSPEVLIKVCMQRISYRPSVIDDLLEPATVWH